MNKMRYEKLDGIRGMALLHMVAYHTIWDLVYLYELDWNWYKEKGAYIWQQGICWTFILFVWFLLVAGQSHLQTRNYCIFRRCNHHACDSGCDATEQGGFWRAHADWVLYAANANL